MIFLADDTWQSWWTIYNQWHNRKHIIFISLSGGALSLLLPLFSDKLMPSSPKVAKSSLQSVFVLCKVLGAPQFFPVEAPPFFTVLRLGEWGGQWMICCNCFKFWPCLHFKCLQSLLLRSCYSPLSVGMDSMTEAADTATASSTCPNFTGLSIAELSFVEQLLCSR